MKLAFIVFALMLLSCSQTTAEEIRKISFSDIKHVKILFIDSINGRTISINNDSLRLIKPEIEKLLGYIKSDYFLNKQVTMEEMINNDNESKIKTICRIFFFFDNNETEYLYLAHDSGLFRTIKIQRPTFIRHSTYAEPIYYNYDDLNSEIETFLKSILQRF